jgi:hypothetical protein
MRQGIFRAVVILLSGLAVLPAQARITQVRAVAAKLVGDRLLLQEDADRIVKQAAESGVLKP